jgi:hypothetical protein
MVELVILFTDLVLEFTSVSVICYFETEGTNKSINHANSFIIRLILVIIDHGTLLDTMILIEVGSRDTLDAVVWRALTPETG